MHPDVAERLLVQEKRLIKNFEHQYHSRIVVLANPALHVEDIRISVSKAPERFGGLMSILGGKKKA